MKNRSGAINAGHPLLIWAIVRVVQYGAIWCNNAINSILTKIRCVFERDHTT